MDMDKIRIADMFAYAAHSSVGQKRKYCGSEYIVHPRRVSNMVCKFGGTEDMIIASLLHDVIEDTKIGIYAISELFGFNVANMVCDLTDFTPIEYGNRKKRKEKYYNQIVNSPKESQIIKLADIIDNSNDVREKDPVFAKVYLKEQLHLLNGMEKVKDHTLFKIAMEKVK